MHAFVCSIYICAHRDKQIDKCTNAHIDTYACTYIYTHLIIVILIQIVKLCATVTSNPSLRHAVLC